MDVACTIWMFVDAKRRNKPDAVKWLVLGIFFGVFPLIAYLVQRKKEMVSGPASVQTKPPRTPEQERVLVLRLLYWTLTFFAAGTGVFWNIAQIEFDQYLAISATMQALILYLPGMLIFAFIPVSVVIGKAMQGKNAALLGVVVYGGCIPAILFSWYFVVPAIFMFVMQIAASIVGVNVLVGIWSITTVKGVAEKSACYYLFTIGLGGATGYACFLLFMYFIDIHPGPLPYFWSSVAFAIIFPVWAVTFVLTLIARNHVKPTFASNPSQPSVSTITDTRLAVTREAKLSGQEEDVQAELKTLEKSLAHVGDLLDSKKIDADQYMSLYETYQARIEVARQKLAKKEV